jgi:hypothetical protein
MATRVSAHVELCVVDRKQLNPLVTGVLRRVVRSVSRAEVDRPRAERPDEGYFAHLVGPD